MSAYPRPAGVRPHILVVNGRKVRQPVFVLGAPCSGVSILARALKRSEGFHLTMGQRWVLPVVHAFARNPLLARGRAEAAATVLRDAFAQGWQVSPHCCLGCSAQCRAAGGAEGTGPCVGDRAISRYGDASPDLLYCAESLVDAFPDARLVQIIRDGRDVVAGMISDADALAWFRPGFVDLDAEYPSRARPGNPGGPGRVAVPVGGRQVRDALAGHRAPDGPAPQRAVRRAAHHLAL